MSTPVTPLQDNRFLILAEFGRGGTSSVVRAFDRIEQRVVAIKATHVARPRSASHPIVREFDRTMRVIHPNVVRHWELRTARTGPLPIGNPYIVMEPIEGRRADRVLVPGAMTDRAVRGLAIAVLGALARIHAAGLVHRDVKPSNLFLASSGEISTTKLADLGHAGPLGIRERPGTLHGSVPYIAPESIMGRPIDGRADLYALGLTLFRLVSGHHPNTGASIESAVKWHLLGPEVDPTPLKRRLSPRLVRFILRLCRRDPDRRPASADCALEELGGPRSDYPAVDESPTLRESRTRLRLDLDAARLGARRLHVLPETPAWSADLRREARVWADTRDLVFQDLRTASPLEFARVTLHLAAALGKPSSTWIRQERLDRLLPITLIGDAAVWRHDAGQANGLSKAIEPWTRFLLRCARHRTVVLGLTGSACRQSRLLNRLRACASDDGSGRGGLLMLTDPPGDRQSVTARDDAGMNQAVACD